MLITWDPVSLDRVTAGKRSVRSDSHHSVAATTDSRLETSDDTTLPSVRRKVILGDMDFS
jgi:hypothetical protein